MSKFEIARRNMIDGQIRPNKVTEDRLIAAMARLPRELFVPAAARAFAYVDEDIDIGGGRYLMEPMVLARLLQAAAITPNEVVLEIGSGSGYGLAVLASLGNTAVGIEQDEALVKAATATLAEAGIDNTAVIEGDLKRGYPTQAPYPVIVFAGAVDQVPVEIHQQLSDGGRLLAVINSTGQGTGQATLIRRHGHHFARTDLFDAATPYLPGFAPAPAFVF